MQGGIQAIFSHGSVIKNAVLHHMRVVPPAMHSRMFARNESAQAASMEEHGFESTKISDVLSSKGKNADGSWLWCTTQDSVYDAVKSVGIFAFSWYIIICFFFWLQSVSSLIFMWCACLPADDTAQCRSFGGGETRGAEIDCRNYHRKRYTGYVFYIIAVD